VQNQVREKEHSIQKKSKQNYGQTKAEVKNFQYKQLADVVESITAAVNIECGLRTT